MSNNASPGTLYLVATPIGNLDDMTFRAVNILKTADLVAAEDTRTSSVLFRHFEIKTPMTAYHEYNERTKGPELIQDLLAGKSVAVITDAGTPGISDPCYPLVKLAIEAGIRVESIPGACAAISALVISGLPVHRFRYEGFLPHKKGRQTRMLSLKEETGSIIFYESPHRVVKLLEEVKEFLGERNVSVSRELTKKFEETIRGSVSDVLAILKSKEHKGEFVVVIEGLSDRRRPNED